VHLSSPLSIEVTSPPSFRARLVVALLAGVAYLNYLDQVMLTTMRKSVVEAIPMGDAQFGPLTSAFLWVYAFMSPVGGYLADRASRTKVIIGNLFFWSAVTWLTAHVTTFNGLILTRVLTGLREACSIPAALVSCALNPFQAANDTRRDFHTDTGSVHVELNAQRWDVPARGATEWTWRAAPINEGDQIYAAQVTAFLDGIEGKSNALCALKEGIQTLRFNLAALQSWQENRLIAL
jgi:hypothetical protein